MTAAPTSEPAADQRWLVVAPHPDDETLGTGVLLQRLVRVGAAVRVLRLTDGEANPWPQRWIERRWRLDAAARARWAARRRDECAAALAALGLDPVDDLVAFGWPDGGVTDTLFAAPAAAVERFRAALTAFGPTHLVVPAADDRHPDHNVVPVIATLALRDLDAPPTLLAYRVHGSGRGDALRLEPTPAELVVRRRALACHGTQLALSGGRFEALVAAPEAYDSDPFAGAVSGGSGWSPAVEWALAALQGRWRWRTAGWDAEGRPWAQERPAGGRRERFSFKNDSSDPIFMKLEPGRRGPWIYDAHGWGRRTPRRA